jgi:hypothetical protein
MVQAVFDHPRRLATHAYFDAFRRMVALASFGSWLACTACAGAPSSASTSFLSESGRLSVELLDDVYSRGEHVIELCVLDRSDGLQVEHLEIELVPFMPAMGHGSSGVSPSQPRSGGCYAFEGVVLSMPGTWELRMSVEGKDADFVAPEVFVQ